MKKIIYGVLIAAFAIAVGYAFFTFLQPTEKVSGKKTDIVIADSELLSDFEGDDRAAELKYKNKVMEVSGPVAKVEQDSGAVRILFDRKGKFIVVCSLESTEAQKAAALSQNTNITIKGVYAGYNIIDEMFMIPAEIKLAQCIIIK